MSGTRTSKGRLYIPPMRVPLASILRAAVSPGIVDLEVALLAVTGV
jgi:hypothetical protein